MASCQGCAESFGFWKRNVGCPKCGYSYCQKCIRFKLDVKDDAELAAKTKGNTLLVCNKCYLQATSSKGEVMDESAYKENVGKAMEVLEMMDDPGKPPITLYRESNRVAALKKGLSFEDQKIVDRLEELRGARRKSDQTDVASRLAKLKDQPYNPTSSSASNILMKSKPETEEDLVARLADQVNLEKKYDKTVVDDIEERLRKLKSAGSNSSSQGADSPAGHSSPNDDGPKSEEDQINELVQRYIAEAALPKQENAVPKESEFDEEDVDIGNSDEDDDDVDYDHCCRICEQKRATLLCRECDDDIFCAKCFTEFHDELGESHRPTKFQNPNTDDENY